MNILFDNVDLGSSSGPNMFGKKLRDALLHRGHTIDQNVGDVQLSFINVSVDHKIPLVQRLDGVYFNSAQDWAAMNVPLRATYERANVVVAQTDFDKALIQHYFGDHDDIRVVRNGTDVRSIDKIKPASGKLFDVQYENVWACASSWRPHKRLCENIGYFVRHRGPNDCLVVAGANPDCSLDYKDVFYAGNLRWENLMSLCKRARYFLHLAFLDHCPNVVVDARACGCQLIVSSTGGTREVAGPEAIVVEEDAWDFEPLALYDPPAIDFSKKISNTRYASSFDIDVAAVEYERALLHALESSW